MSTTQEVTHSIVEAASMKLASGDTNAAHVFEHEGKKFVLKERHGEYDTFPSHYSLYEIAEFFNKALNIAKKYFREEMISTLYFISTNNQGKTSLFTLQPFIEGVRGAEARKGSLLNLKWGQKVMKDPAWQDLPNDVYTYFSKSDLWGPNLITQEDGTVKIVDF